MKKFIRIISLAMLILVLSTQLIYAIDNETKTKTFNDLSNTHWAYESVEKLVKAGFIHGYPDGTFKPEGDITRAELIKIVNLVFNFTEKQETTSLIDVKSDDWFYDFVLIAENSGYIIGYPDGTFQPNGFITRQELCKILDVINSFVELPFDRSIVDDVSPWAVTYVNKIVSNRIMLLDENNNFRATEKATRAEVCDALAKFVIEEPSVEEPQLPVGGGSNSGSDEITKEELNTIMADTITILEKNVLNDSELSDNQKEIIKDIINNMKKYVQNNNYDYETPAKATYEKFEQLHETERGELEDKIVLYVPTQYLIDLQGFFFPDVKIDM